MLSIDETKEVIWQNFYPKPMRIEKVQLSKAHNRVLSEDVKAPAGVPPFDRSTVDGYAVKAEDTFGADENQPVYLEICGRVSVGEVPTLIIQRGVSAEIATGAPIPQGADGVVMKENVIDGESAISIYRAISKDENVMKAGSDIQKGERILEKGQTLSSREIGVLAALGLKEVMVYSRPIVAIISTGGEIVELGQPLPLGKIYDINSYSINVAVLECGGTPLMLGIVPDNLSELEAALRKALNLADIVITSGGISVGPRDLVPKVLNTLGHPGVIVYGVASKPGKPTTISMVEGKPIFSLPGHPASSLLMFHVLVRPIILAMAGRHDEAIFKARATILSKVFPAKGRRTFVMVSLSQDKSGRLLASTVPPGLSGAITTLAKADGFIEVEEDQQFINAREEVTIHLFKPLHGSS